MNELRTAELTTKVLTVELKPTDAKHIFVSGDATVRGKTKHFNAHLHLWSNGVWHLGNETDSSYNLRHALYPSDLTEAFRKTLLDDLVLAVNNWAKNGGGALIEEARVEARNRAIENRKEEIRKHEEALAHLYGEVERLENGEDLPSRSEKVKTWH